MEMITTKANTERVVPDATYHPKHFIPQLLKSALSALSQLRVLFTQNRSGNRGTENRGTWLRQQAKGPEQFVTRAFLNHEKKSESF